MAILARIFQFILWLILATWLGRKLLGALFGVKPGAPAVQPKSARQLHRDPACGTHVSPEISFTLEHEGTVHHFCSADCRAKFALAQRARASA